MNQKETKKNKNLRKSPKNYNQKNKLFRICTIVCGIVLLGVFCFGKPSYAVWVEEDDGIKYLQDDGQYAIGFIDIEDNRYYFDLDGHLVTGKFYVEEDGAYYYADESGVLQYGVIQTEKDFFITDETGKLQTGFVEFDKKRYYFNEIAQLVVGWFKFEDNWYYASSTGVVQTGFVEVDGYRYYLNEDGTRTSASLLEIDGKSYVFNEDGSVDENATETYPVFQYMNSIRNDNGCGELILNSKVQACALLRASDLQNGFSLENTDSIEKLLGNRGVMCSGGYEFAYGGLKEYDFERLKNDMEKDVNMSRVLSDDKVTEVGIGIQKRDGVSCYSIVFISDVSEEKHGE